MGGWVSAVEANKLDVLLQLLEELEEPSVVSSELSPETQSWKPRDIRTLWPVLSLGVRSDCKTLASCAQRIPTPPCFSFIRRHGTVLKGWPTWRKLEGKQNKAKNKELDFPQRKMQTYGSWGTFSKLQLLIGFAEDSIYFNNDQIGIYSILNLIFEIIIEFQHFFHPLPSSKAFHMPLPTLLLIHDLFISLIAVACIYV